MVFSKITFPTNSLTLSNAIPLEPLMSIVVLSIVKPFRSTKRNQMIHKTEIVDY
jgi:hypothetical protein